MLLKQSIETIEIVETQNCSTETALGPKFKTHRGIFCNSKSSNFDNIFCWALTLTFLFVMLILWLKLVFPVAYRKIFSQDYYLTTSTSRGHRLYAAELNFANPVLHILHSFILNQVVLRPF
jgi:hypothetical protein